MRGLTPPPLLNWCWPGVGGGAQAQSLALYPIISLPVCVGDVSELVCMYADMLYIRVTTFLRFVVVYFLL